ncbi:unnamed protein product [Schistosoma guineensis]|nr:unnamed protein product [Schistosoma guineensis]
MALLSFTITWLLLFQQNINAEYYTAVIDITKAWRLSQELVSDLNSYIALEERRLNRIRKVVKVLDANGSISDASSTLSQQNNDLEEYLGNPINAYLTMKRLSSSWKSQISQLVDNVPNGFQKSDTDGSDYLNISDAQNTITMNTIRSRVKQHTDMLPGDNDVSGAVDAILRLQSTYKLPARQLAYGQLIDNLSTPQLSAAQCLEVGRHAYSQGDFEQSEEWFRVAYDRLFDELEQKKEVDAQGTTIASDETEENGETEPTVGQILDYLAYSLGRQGRYAEALNVTRLLIEEDAFEVKNGNRIATIIFYLSDVQAGGATVFNRIGTRVVPKKGAAGFWFNLLPSGEGDLRTRHAACPVLAGSKWVMNLWFHERGQEFHRPCELERGAIETDDGF